MTFEEANDIVTRADEYFTRGRCRGEVSTPEELQKAIKAFDIKDVIYLCQDCVRFADCGAHRNRIYRVSKCNFHMRYNEVN